MFLTSTLGWLVIPTGTVTSVDASGKADGPEPFIWAYPSIIEECVGDRCESES